MTDSVNQIDPRLIQMRHVLLQTVSEKYQSLVETINKIPLLNDFKSEAIRQINGGFLWAKEGISVLSFSFENPKEKESEGPTIEIIPDSNKEPVIQNDENTEF